MTYLIDVVDSLQEDYVAMQNAVAKLREVVAFLTIKNDVSYIQPNRYRNQEKSENSWNERTCPTIPLSEEEVHNTINSWLSTGEIKLHHPRVPPTENEKFHPRFCRYH